MSLTHRARGARPLGEPTGPRGVGTLRPVPGGCQGVGGGEALVRPASDPDSGGPPGPLGGPELGPAAWSSSSHTQSKEWGVLPEVRTHDPLETRGAAACQAWGTETRAPGPRCVASERDSWAGASWPGGREGAHEGQIPQTCPSSGQLLARAPPKPIPTPPSPPPPPTAHPRSPRSAGAEPSCAVPAQGRWVLPPSLPAQLPAGSVGALLPPTAPLTPHPAYL